MTNIYGHAAQLLAGWRAHPAPDVCNLGGKLRAAAAPDALLEICEPGHLEKHFRKPREEKLGLLSRRLVRR